jgi:L-2-hydroxyglutarate oxidase LhgO
MIGRAKRTDPVRLTLTIMKSGEAWPLEGGWPVADGTYRTGGVGVVGGGIVGLAVARQLLLDRPGERVVVLEKEADLAGHQTGHNSGVVHAGLYYPPGSLKATLCRRGAGLLRDYCLEHGLPYDAAGKLVVARDRSEVARLDAIANRAVANGVPGLRRLGPDGIREVEPHVTGVAALHSPETAVTDFAAVARALAGEVSSLGGQVWTCSTVSRIAAGPPVELTASGRRWRFGSLVVCAGLHSDRLARMVGADRSPAVVPFRGEYRRLVPGRRHLVRGLVYPVPDPALPFLGVHLTRHVDGEVTVGPNAVLALSREGYRRRDVSPRDVVETLRWPGFWRLVRSHWRAGSREAWESLTPRAFAEQARTFVPDLRVTDLAPGPAGVRAQALDRRGRLLEDFVVERRGEVVLVRNAPSPAATSALAIAEHLVRERL